MFSSISTGSIIASLKSVLHKYFNAWLTRRIPQASRQQINHRNIFIMPTRFGAGLLMFMLLLFLLGTNYQNNVIILISYLLVSFFIVVLHHSFFNLSGLQFKATNSLQGFVDSTLYFPLVITSKKVRFTISFSFDQARVKTEQVIDHSVDENKSSKRKPSKSKPSNSALSKTTLAQLEIGENNIRIPYRVCQRGQYPLGRVLIISEFGFGLFKAWTRLDFAQQVTAYPKPIANVWTVKQQNLAIEVAENNLESYQDSFQPGQDEFHQLQHYQLGEPLSRVAWKHVAQGQGWLTKQYQQALSGKLQLDFERLPNGTLEQRLSWLSYAIKDCSTKQIAFSLKLPDQVVEYDHSAQHTLKCLTALARY
ncbi:DUF58 domain-containing protein [Colwellia sp. MB02u-18]|uniref:DUF58 domain-containing protein n=1 Tax=unclassified Colwellia TaxID=196834 RepID=UPI0015F3CCCF|nr:MULTISPECIES: DUF58 domain-containing protein [unclassified Colwellia]MBA6222722.1 DUF58 domain-containing protein [Colwellia sp. MB3u-45]MBA6266071.1 DUF58 domain-containing protein [Colwellia sp. MB3u-43]MBA6320511.1 DUF58 domain-containing protein [Colwellia sp. MB02u-19]MBA6323398.1 DUF58 domain-containing protein [Colwellia sp. MB02u-18]MBA6329896.1 DUF58 domain-containing protein [Colwellia sp. MB02u-12]